MNIPIIKDLISFTEAKKIGKEYYPDLIKGVVDINRQIIAIGGEMHVDAEEVLLKDGSKQSDLWGFNILTEKDKENFRNIAHDSSYGPTFAVTPTGQNFAS